MLTIVEQDLGSVCAMDVPSKEEEEEEEEEEMRLAMI